MAQCITCLDTGMQDQNGTQREGLVEVLDRLPDLAAKIWPISHVMIGMSVCSQLRVILPCNVERVHIRANRALALCDAAVYAMLSRFKCGIFLNTDRVHTASDVVAMLQAACGPGGAGWRGPEGLQLSSHYEAPKFKGLGNHGMELFVSAALPHLKSLRALDLGYNSIGPAGARTLVEGLTGVPALASSLTALSLRINVLGDAGVATIASALHRLPNMQHLDLCNNWIQSAGAEALAGGLRGLKNLATLDVSKNNIKTAGLAFISAVLVELPAVSQVCLSKNSIDEHGGASARAILRQCPQLVFCDLSCNRLGPLGAAQVAGGLGEAQRLEHVDLDCNELGAAGALLFAKALVPQGNDARPSDAGMSAPASAVVTGAAAFALRHLHLFNNRMGAEGTLHLASVLNLFPLLCSLDLGHQFMYAAGAADLAEALPACLLLESLSLNNNFIGPEGATSLAGALARCKKLRILNLSRNQLTDAGAQTLAGFAEAATPLAVLYLSNNELRKAASLRPFFPSGLQDMDISGNELVRSEVEELTLHMQAVGSKCEIHYNEAARWDLCKLNLGLSSFTSSDELEGHGTGRMLKIAIASTLS